MSAVPPSIEAAVEGATLIVNCSASNEIAGKEEYRRSLIAGAVCTFFLPDMYMSNDGRRGVYDRSLCLEDIILLQKMERF